MSDTVTFTLDGEQVTAKIDASLWEIAKAQGTLIPHLCHKDSEGYRADGNCRACMVEIEGERVLAASCIRTPTEGMVVNISRAANIDEEALLDALEAKTLGFAALDVFEGEPVVNPRFMKLDNVLLQPHQGSGTVHTRKAMGDLVRGNLVAHFNGEPLLTPI